MVFEQTKFDAGMNLILPDTQIPVNGYVRLINGRQRLGYIEPNFASRLLTAPVGKKQGICSVGSVLIAFIAGRAYYNVDGSVVWVQISGFAMDSLVSRYYTQAVPASTMSFIRKTTTAEGFDGPVILSSDFSVSGTPSCVVVQDTINQPWLIFHDAVNNTLTARVSKNYSQWANISVTADDREYVPIGRQMMFINQGLHVVSRDKKSVYRSVTGRPLDFMVVVDRNGNKLANEMQGGATATSYSFDFDDITCLQAINVTDTFVYGTARNVRMVTLDYTNKIFGEPKFNQSAIIESGIVNQDSFIEILGDYAFVDFENAKTFNAVQQLKFEGRNSIFSLQLTGLLRNIKQSSPAVTVFDNYGLFYIQTNMGNLVAVYDILREAWVALDITSVGEITQFTTVETPTESKLYCITENDEIFQMYDSTQERETTYLFTRALANDSFAVQHKSQIVRPVFKSGTETGTVGIVEYVDDMEGQRLTNTLTGVTAGITFPIQFPIIFSSQQQVNNASWLLKNGNCGHKLSYIIHWNSDAQLKGFIALTTDSPRDTSLEQANQIYAHS